MKKNLLVRAMLVAVLLVCCNSCDDREEIPSSQPKSEKVSCNPHAISQEQALASLQDFMNSFENVATRSAMQSRRVKDIYPVEFRKDVTRAGADTIDCENLLYVVNFENEQGFAILAADDRVKDDVLAVVEQGSMSPQVMKAVSHNNGGTMRLERPLVSGFPTTGPCYIRAVEDDDEFCMNPNTADLADTIVNVEDQSLDVDTIVGNFDPDSAMVTHPYEGPEIKEPDKDPIIDLNGELVGGFIYENARNDLYDDDVANGESGHNGNGGNTNNGNGTAGASHDGSYVAKQYSGWSAVNITSSLLASYCKWDQKSPFNDLNPRRRKFLIGKRRKAPAGCFPLAIAKIFTLYKYPDTFVDNGVTVNWDELGKNPKSEVGALSAAHLLHGISEGCDSWYFYNGTFTRPKRAISYLRRQGLENVKKRDYSFESVKAMIDKKFPVIIYACPRINVFKSHCWNIDGYQVMQRTVTTRVYNASNIMISMSASKETRNMVHCDFGWGGSYNGYYTSGVFKLNDPSAKLDDSQSASASSTHFNNFKHIITYDIPNR